MVPFASWVKGLIARCAKTDETNSFTKVNTFQKSPVIQGIIDMSQGPQNGNNGTVSAITFTDASNATVGSVCATYSNTEAKGMYLKVNQGKLGIEKTDENRYVTYSPTPIEEGGDNQIATYGYVQDSLDDINEDFSSIYSRLTQAEEDIAGLLSAYNGLQIPALSQTPNTTETDKAISSAGVANALSALESRLTQIIEETCRSIIESTLISSIGFTKTQIISKAHKTTFTYTPTEPGIIVIGWNRNGHNLYFTQDGKDMKGSTYDYIGEYVNKGVGILPLTFALTADVEYEWQADDGIDYVFWTPLTFSIGG